MSVEPLTPAEIPSALLSRIKQHWYECMLAVEELPAGPEATAVTIALSDVRELIHKVPGCKDFWKHPFERAAQSRELETLRAALREIVENPDWDAPENPTTRAQFDRARSLLASSDPTDAEKAQFIAGLALINENLDVEETTMSEFLAEAIEPPDPSPGPPKENP